MQIDKPEHQAFLLQVINSVSYPGGMLDLAFEVRQAIQGAEMKLPANDPIAEAVAAPAKKPAAKPRRKAR